MQKILVTYGIALALFLVVDFIWLGAVAREFYKVRLGPLLNPSPNLTAAALFYLFYAAGLVFFAVQPAWRGHSWRIALLNGEALGFIAYGTYDFTNLATIRNWSLALTLTDLAWGTVLSGLVATLAYTVSGWLA